jgi:hypothetical protein
MATFRWVIDDSAVGALENCIAHAASRRGVYYQLSHARI